MISKFIGTFLRKDLKTKQMWVKLAISLILSNIFFFILFSQDSKNDQKTLAPSDQVEIELAAQLLTPFHFGKKVLLIHRTGRKKIEGVLQTMTAESGRITVLVKETHAQTLLQHETWEILPYLNNFNFVSVKKGISHEIRY